jgi:O-antigen ligase
VVLTASRTGLLSVACWRCGGWLDRRLPPRARLLLAAPLLYAWPGAAWPVGQVASRTPLAAPQRLAESDISGSRFGIWANTLDLIRAHPWAGVGFGEFNFAWTLTPFPGRPVAFFDHTHNLPLQLAVELGLPWPAWCWACCCCGPVAGRAPWAECRRPGTAQRSAMLMVLMIGLHSLLEYPLWYAYFLLPTAWAWGFALQGDDSPATQADPAPHPPHAACHLAALVLVLGAGAVGAGLRRVAAIFSAAGRRSTACRWPRASPTASAACFSRTMPTMRR